MTPKYAIIIPDGLADVPLPTLGGRTPVEAADTPQLDALARAGELGLVRTTPAGLAPGSDVTHLAILGYDAARCYTGRAPIEAASMDIALGDALAVRANLVTVRDGRLESYAAGGIESDEAHPLIAALNAALVATGETGARFFPGVSYRHLLRLADAEPFDRTPPHDLSGQPVAGHAPGGPQAARLAALEAVSRQVFAEHPVNRARIARGALPATQVWLWGAGRALTLEPFQRRTGRRGAVISAVDLVRGLGRAAGMTVLDVPGATGGFDTDYAAKGAAAATALETHDLVLVHVEAPDEAAHAGRADEKVRALERIDRHVVGPLVQAARARGRVSLLVLPDHATSTITRTHFDAPVPFVIWRRDPPAGAEILDRMGFRTTDAGSGRAFSERAAAATGLLIEPGHALLGRLLAG